MLLGSAWDTQSRGAVLKKKITYLAFNCFSVKKLLMERKKQNKTAIPQRTNHGPKNIRQCSANVSQTFSDHYSPKRSLLNFFFFSFPFCSPLLFREILVGQIYLVMQSDTLEGHKPLQQLGFLCSLGRNCLSPGEITALLRTQGLHSVSTYDSLVINSSHHQKTFKTFISLIFYIFMVLCRISKKVKIIY